MSDLLEISTVQGSGLESEYAGQVVSVVGVVTSLLRYGFYLQNPSVAWDGERSNAIFCTVEIISLRLALG